MFSSAGRTRTHIGGRQVLGMKLEEDGLAYCSKTNLVVCAPPNFEGRSQLVDMRASKLDSKILLPACIEENQP